MHREEYTFKFTYTFPIFTHTKGDFKPELYNVKDLDLHQNLKLRSVGRCHHAQTYNMCDTDTSTRGRSILVVVFYLSRSVAAL
jgi:hypothetical protein